MRGVIISPRFSRAHAFLTVIVATPNSCAAASVVMCSMLFMPKWYRERSVSATKNREGVETAETHRATLPGCLWFPIWMLCLMNQVWNCDRCGAKTYGSKAGLWFERGILATFFLLAGIIGLIAVSAMAFRPQ